jgi:hypothetical protein
MTLMKTHAGAQILVTRDAAATDAGSDRSPICVLLVDADRLAPWENRERVRAAPDVALEVWSRG